MSATHSFGARRWRQGLVALATLASSSLLAPSIADAFVFTNPKHEISIEIAPAQDEKLCVIAPRGHIDPAACGPLDEATADKQLKQMEGGEFAVVGLAFLESNERILIVSIMASGPPTLDITRSPDIRARGLVKGMAEGSGAVLDVRDTQIVQVAGRDALFVTAGTDEATVLPISFAVTHQIPTRDVDLLFSLSTEKKNQAWAADVSARAMKTMRAPMPPSKGEQILDALTSKPGDADPGSDLEHTRARWRMYGYAARIGIIAVVIIGFVIYAKRRNDRMRRQTAERMAQGLNPNDRSRRD